MTIFVAVPSYTGIRPETVGSITQLMVELNLVMPGSSLNILSDNADIRYVRSEQVGAFLYTTAEEFLFIDNDIAFNPELIARMHGVNADFVVGAYRKRHPPDYEYCIRLLDGVNHPTESPTRMVEGERLIEVGGSGMGCVLIKRRVLEAVRDAHPELTYISENQDKPVVMMFQPGIYEVEGKPRPLGEDFAFCFRVRDAGFKIECLVDAQLDHAGIKGNLAEFFPPRVAEESR